AIVESLRQHGKPADTPAAAIHWGTTADQRTVTAALAELPVAVQQAGLKAPTVVIIGSVAALRSRLAWAESRPLHGRHVLVTRPREQAGDLVRRLEELGARASVLPAVEIRPPADWGPVDAALRQLDRYDWLVFTSANGVRFFLGRLREVGKDL